MSNTNTDLVRGVTCAYCVISGSRNLVNNLFFFTLIDFAHTLFHMNTYRNQHPTDSTKDCGLWLQCLFSPVASFSCQFFFFPSYLSCCNLVGSQMAQKAQRECRVLIRSHSVVGLKMLKIVALASWQPRMSWEHQSGFWGQYCHRCCCSSFAMHQLQIMITLVKAGMRLPLSG